MTLATLSSANEHKTTGTLDEAVHLLGPDAIRTLALSTFCAAPAPTSSFDMEAFWEHAIICRLLAQELAEQVEDTPSNLAGFTDLLHDIGKLALGHIHPEVYNRMPSSSAGIREERLAFGKDHVVVGRQMLEKNRLPAPMGEAIWLHHQPEHLTTLPDLSGCVYLANKMACTPPLGSQGDPEALAPFLVPFGLADDEVKILTASTRSTLSKLKQVLPSSAEVRDHWHTMQQRGSSLLRRNIAEMGAGTNRLQQKIRVLDSLPETVSHLSIPVDTEEVLRYITRTARTVLQAHAVECTFHPLGGELLQSTVGSSTGSPSARPVTATIDAQEWGKGMLSATYQENIGTPDASQWLTLYADLAGATIAGLHRFQRLQTLADQFMIQQNEDVSTAAQSTPAAQDIGLQDLNAMAAQVAHIFNNLLAGILGHTQLLLKRPDKKEKMIGGLQAIERAVLNGSQIIHHLQLASQTDPQVLDQKEDLNVLIQGVVEELQGSLETAGVKISMSLQDQIDAVACRTEELRLMFSQVILNAIEAMPDGGDLTISTSQKGQTIFFKAGDTGLGISPDTAVDLFKPLFTTKYVQTVPAG